MNLFHVIKGALGKIRIQRAEPGEGPPDGAVPKGAVCTFSYEEATGIRNMLEMQEILRISESAEGFTESDIDNCAVGLRRAKVEAEEILAGVNDGSLTVIPLIKRLRSVATITDFALSKVFELYRKQKRELEKAKTLTRKVLSWKTLLTLVPENLGTFQEILNAIPDDITVNLSPVEAAVCVWKKRKLRKKEDQIQAELLRQRAERVVEIPMECLMTLLWYLNPLASPHEPPFELSEEHTALLEEIFHSRKDEDALLTLLTPKGNLGE